MPPQGSNTYLCEGCKKQVTAVRRLRIQRLPKMVAFHIKRFTTHGSRAEKLFTNVTYPLKARIVYASLYGSHALTVASYARVIACENGSVPPTYI